MTTKGPTERERPSLSLYLSTLTTILDIWSRRVTFGTIVKVARSQQEITSKSSNLELTNDMKSNMNRLQTILGQI